ncbi:type IV secretion system protein [Legionella saoudiensis]|uniref:type IV secretion system protein n=1 Tax=Legionella saoudiensis TaxID=1750561 RepID=UPI0007315031|nr:type IV secretion system protein [Legionella saoudiensis]
MRLNPVMFFVFFGLSCVMMPECVADPAGDAAIIAKLVDQLRQMEKQYKLLDKTYKTHGSQLKGIQQLNKYNSGHSGYGRLFNSLSDVQRRQSANTWKESLKGISGGNPERYRELVSAYEAQHSSLNKQRFSQGASLHRTEQFDGDRQVTQTVSIESEVLFNDINDSLKRVHDLSEQIEKAQNTKAAVDLNSRLLTEIAYIEVQKLKAQSLLNHLLVSQSGSGLTDEAELSQYLAR